MYICTTTNRESNIVLDITLLINMDCTKQYKIKISSNYEEWWRYNIFLTTVGYDEMDQVIFYKSITDRPYEITGDDEYRSNPLEGERLIELNCSDLAYRAELYLYVITNTYPQTPIIREWPPFKMTLQVEINGEIAEQSDHEVNQWGGTTLIGYKLPE